jgi:uncharacterized protein
VAVLETRTELTHCTDHFAAGDFAAWLAQIVASFRGGTGSEVPCGDCSGCCASSYFIHVRPTDRKTLAVVPKALLNPAPGMPRGHKLIGFSADGSCPLLLRGNCSIYGQRAQTCRDYDCRVFAAAGIDAGGPERAAVNQRVRAWRFSYAKDQDVQIHRAIKSAAAFILNRRAAFPGGRAPVAPGDIAALAIKVHHIFLISGQKDKTPAATAEAIIQASRAFEMAPTAN